MGHILSETIIKDLKSIINNEDKVFISSSFATGVDRAEKAIKTAMLSPLYKSATIANCNNVILLITIGLDQIALHEISKMCDYIQRNSMNNANIIMNVAEDNNLENAIGITIIATGFKSKINLFEVNKS